MKCSFCKKEIEDMAHFFYECEIRRKIWNEISNWIYEKLKLEFCSLHKILFLSLKIKETMP